MKSSSRQGSEIQTISALFSLLWQTVANGVGLLLASMLIWPGLNEVLSPFTYGRWIPLHMDWHLYGWCFMPLLAILIKRYLQYDTNPEYWALLCMVFWSAALLGGGLSWLAGDSTGKPFLNWKGFGGAVFTASQIGIWVVLMIAYLKRLALRKENKDRALDILADAILLLLLAGVPFLLRFLSDPKVYPPVNPDSGGATGHSLFLSTLSLVLIMGLLPQFILGLGLKAGKRGRFVKTSFWAVFSASLIVYIGIDHGNTSNRELDQVWGLGSLLIWPFLVGVLWRQFEWSNESNLWFWSFIIWWGLLIVDGWVIFLPEILDTLKFTNGLVAHSHLAMAGMITSLNMLILIEMGGSIEVRSTLSKKWPNLLWNGGCILYVVVMTLQGWREGREPTVLFNFDGLTASSYWIRLLAGTAMFVASIYWSLSLLFRWMAMMRKRNLVSGIGTHSSDIVGTRIEFARHGL